jgi:hypothetical protein
MQVVGLDGQSTYWALKGGISHGQVSKKSDLHLQARELIHKCYPTLQVLEEIPIYIRKAEILYLDFYLPLIKKAIEVHGKQHYEFVRFYHQTALGFIKHQKRDKDKKEWCLLNGITYTELPYNNTDSWEQFITNGN